MSRNVICVKKYCCEKHFPTLFLVAKKKGGGRSVQTVNCLICGWPLITNIRLYKGKYFSFRYLLTFLARRNCDPPPRPPPQYLESSESKFIIDLVIVP